MQEGRCHALSDALPTAAARPAAAARLRLGRDRGQLAHQRELARQGRARRLEAQRARVRLRREQRVHVAEVLVRRRVARVGADRLLERGARLVVVARAPRRARPGCCTARPARGSPATSCCRIACASAAAPRCRPGSRPCRKRICASLRLGRQDAVGALAAPRRVWPARCRRVTSLSSSARGARGPAARRPRRAAAAEATRRRGS